MRSPERPHGFGSQDLSYDENELLLKAIESGDYSCLNWEVVCSSIELDSMLIELGHKISASKKSSHLNSANGNGNIVNDANELITYRGVHVKPYNYLSLLTEIMVKLLKDPEAKAFDFDRWMKMTSFDGKTTTSIIDLVFDVLPYCITEFTLPVMKQPHLATSKLHSMVSVKDHLLPTTLAFAFRISTSNFKILERTLFRNLLTDITINIVVAQDMFCLISRSNPCLRIQWVDVLMKIHGKVLESQAENVSLLLNRLLGFHAEIDWDDFLSRVDIAHHPHLIPGLANAPKKVIETFVDKYVLEHLSGDDVSVDKLVTITELIILQEEPDNDLVKKVLNVLSNTELLQESFDFKNADPVRRCILKLNKHLKIKFVNDVISNYEVKVSKNGNEMSFETAYFIFQLLKEMAERISDKSKYQKNILLKSMIIVDKFIDNDLILELWLQFAHKFCSSVKNQNIIIEYFNVQNSKTPLRPRVLFQKYLTKRGPSSSEDDMRELELVGELLSTPGGNSSINDIIPVPILEVPTPPEPTNLVNEEDVSKVLQSMKQFIKVLDDIGQNDLKHDDSIQSELVLVRDKIDTIIGPKKQKSDSDDDVIFIP